MVPATVAVMVMCTGVGMVMISCQTYLYIGFV